jgi:hypothetical protein
MRIKSLPGLMILASFIGASLGAQQVHAQSVPPVGAGKETGSCTNADGTNGPCRSTSREGSGAARSSGSNRGSSGRNDNPSPPPGGTPSKYPNVIYAEDGKLAPGPGYQWVSGKKGDFRVELLPGLIQNRDGTVQPDSDSTWVSPNDPTDFRVKLLPGLIEDEKGHLHPASGYTWVSPNDPSDHRVKLITGLVRGENGSVHPASGYTWVSPNDPSDNRVKLIPGLVRGENGQLHPDVGYAWASPSPNDLRVIKVEGSYQERAYDLYKRGIKWNAEGEPIVPKERMNEAAIRGAENQRNMHKAARHALEEKLAKLEESLKTTPPAPDGTVDKRRNQLLVEIATVKDGAAKERHYEIYYNYIVGEELAKPSPR